MRRAVTVLTAVAAVTAGVAAVAGAAWVAWPLPEGLLAPPASATVTLFDRHGQPLRSAWADDGADRRWVPLADVDPDVVRAIIALEDNRFYRHPGVDPVAAARAARDNLRSGRVVSGASTITMQLARLVRSGRRSWTGKLGQAAWALRLEAQLSKQEILEQYLNRVPLGGGAVGVGAAAQRYFGAAPGRLSLAESALLASLARAPSRDNPLADETRATQVRARALGRLRVRGMISRRDSARAAAEPLPSHTPTPFDAPHFTTAVLGWLDREAPEAAGGATHASRLPAASAVMTTIDLSLQAEIESEVRHTAATLADRGARHAAAVVLQNATGAILAWVGSPDFDAPDHGQVDMVVSARQPGSALKPFLYGLAFDHGYSPASVLPDVARAYVTATAAYSPRNYDRRFHGPVTAREALASSHNVPAVELTERLGTAALLATLHRAGFGSLDRSPDHYGLGLALGNGDVTLIELANGYRALARDGAWTPWTWRAAVAAEAAGAAELSPPVRRSVISPLAAALVLDILADPVARIPGFGAATPFDFPFPTAVKTGTSRNFTDNWAVAVTGGFTVAVWVGDAAGRPMRQVSGVTGAGPLLRRAVTRVARRYPPGVLPTPADRGARAVAVCRVSGGLPAHDCPTRTEWIPPDIALAACDWHRDGRLVLPAVYADWAAAGHGLTSSGQDGRTGEREDVRTGVRIVSPADGDRYGIPAGVDPRYATLPLRATTPEGDGGVRWFVDGRPVAGDRWQLVSGIHTVRALSRDGASDEVRIVVD
jgi:penicillin-binding protein 1C